MKKRLLDELNNHYNAAKMRDIMLIGTMMCLLLMCIITKLATTDLYMNEYQRKTTVTSSNETAILHYLCTPFQGCKCTNINKATQKEHGLT